MINVTDEIKQDYDASTTQVDKIIVDNQEYRISNVEYYDDVYEEGNVFGTAIARCLDFEIENIVDLEQKEVKYLTGIKTNGLIQWISLGNFIVQDVDVNDTLGITKVTAMDYMIKTNIDYSSELNYSDRNVTIIDVLQEVCTKSDITLATIDFPNADFIVDSNQFEEGTLNRQVIQAIAQISGTIAKIKNDNCLYLINPNQVTNVSKIFTLNNYEEAEIKRFTHPINAVSLGMADVEGENITLRDEESITKEGENILAINDNPFAYTQAKREQLITALFDAVKGFEYKAYSFKCQGIPFLETLDKIYFKDKSGNIYDSYIFRFNYKSPNGLESTIEAPSITKATVNYQNIPSALDIAKRTELKVDKQEQKITGIINNQTEFDSKLTQVEQSVDEISQQVSKIADFTRTTTGVSEIHLEQTVEGEGYVLNFQIQGSTAHFVYLTPSNSLVPSDSLVPLDGGYFHIVSDKQNKTTMSDEAQIIKVYLNEPLRSMEEIYDELNIENGVVTVIRKIGVNEDLSLYILETPRTENLGNINIKTFKDDTYVYIKEYEGINYSAKYIIENDYSDVFVTKAETTSQIKQLATEVEINVNKKLDDYSTTTEMNSAISSTAEEINLEVSKKVGEDEIISKINQSAEAVGINANKIELSANDVLNLLAGNTINLASKNIIISSDYFNTDKHGKVTINSNNNNTDAFTVKSKEDSSFSYVQPGGIGLVGSNGRIDIQSQRKSSSISFIDVQDSNGKTNIQGSGITTPKLTQTSKEENKKNFEKFKNGLDVIKSTDIYKYNLKNETNKEKKHIGFVIGDKYNYSKEITSKNNDGVDIYSMISVVYKAIQEQQEMIEDLKIEISKLKGESNG